MRLDCCICQGSTERKSLIFYSKSCLAAAYRKSLFWIKYNFPQLRSFQFQTYIDLNNRDLGLFGHRLQIPCYSYVPEVVMDSHIPNTTYCRLCIILSSSKHSRAHQPSRVVAVAEMFLNVAQVMNVYTSDRIRTFCYVILSGVRTSFQCGLNRDICM